MTAPTTRNREMSREKTKPEAVQTTGHAWDGDLQEFNNPLPRWWLWSFYATVVFALIYWLLYPTWPVGGSYTKGLATVTYTNEQGEEVTSNWNTRALLIKDMQEAKAAQAQYMDQLQLATYTDIIEDPTQSSFAYSRAKVLFADNCAACHQEGGAGVIGMYPNLADDDWLWGASFDAIEHSIREGRVGYMPGFKASLNDEQLDAVSHYVLSLSDHEVDGVLAAQGRDIFNGPMGGCYYCHTMDGTGLESQGAANLTDSVWTIADVPGADSIQEKLAAVRQVVSEGVTREMPAWKGRLSDTEIKILTFYVHELGGG